MKFAFNHPVLFQWLAAKTGMPCSDGHTIGVLSEAGDLTGVFHFCHYTGAGIELTIAGSGCVNRTAWQVVGEFVFGRMGCTRLQITTRADNKRVRRMAEAFGFVQEGVARRYYGDHDGVVYSLLKDEAVARGHYQEIIFVRKAA